MTQDSDLAITMPQMPSPRLLAFVEGRMERLFINNNFNYIEVIPINNGITWTTQALARQIVTFFKARNFYGDGIIVWADRERRIESAQQIFDTIHAALTQAGADPNTLHILISDVMVENVILADELLMRHTLASPTYSYNFEGQGGKHRLKAFLADIGLTYKETREGLRLLKQTRLRNCASVSPAVARFTATFNHQCWWV